MNLIDALFCGLRFYRRLRGGKWERWWVDHPVCDRVWHRVWQWSGYGPRPTVLCRGTPTREEWK